MRITNADKVTLALLLEEGRARIGELQFHLTMTKSQIRATLDRMVQRGAVVHEAASNRYALASVHGLGPND
jgi:DNA-binding IclR family transcriptional regulator